MIRDDRPTACHIYHFVSCTSMLVVTAMVEDELVKHSVHGSKVPWFHCPTPDSGDSFDAFVACRSGNQTTARSRSNAVFNPELRSLFVDDGSSLHPLAAQMPRVGRKLRRRSLLRDAVQLSFWQVCHW